MARAIHLQQEINSVRDRYRVHRTWVRLAEAPTHHLSFSGVRLLPYDFVSRIAV